MATAAPAPPRPHRYSVHDYYRMAETGILPHGARVELIEGETFDMTPIGRRHAYCVDQLTKRLVLAAADHAVVRVQNPVRLSDFSEPQPDLALLRLPAEHYAERHPGPEDVLLIVEVADSSLGYDRDVKLPLYAQYGIPEVWLVDMEKRQVTRYSQPTGDGYSMAALLGDRAAPLALPDCALDLTGIC